MYSGPVDLAQYYIKVQEDQETSGWPSSARRGALGSLAPPSASSLHSVADSSAPWWRSTCPLSFSMSSPSAQTTSRLASGDRVRMAAFLQDFFFEAVVTVNLASLLVLSTMFVGGLLFNSVPAKITFCGQWLDLNSVDLLGFLDGQLSQFQHPMNGHCYIIFGYERLWLCWNDLWSWIWLEVKCIILAMVIVKKIVFFT